MSALTTPSLDHARSEWAVFVRTQKNAESLLGLASDHFHNALPLGTLVTFRKGNMARKACGIVKRHGLGFWTNDFTLEVENQTTGKDRWISYSDIDEILEVPGA